MEERISAAICTRNRCESLVAAVRSVLRENPDELVIIDQSDGPEARLLMEGLNDARVKYVHTPVAGLSRAYNLALRLSENELIAFTDDDCVVPAGWLDAARAVAQENPEAALIYGQVVAGTDDIPPGAYIPELRFDRAEKFASGGPFRIIGMGANFAARRSELLAVGGFDEALGGGGIFRSSQDFDLQFRLWRAGKTVMIHPGLRVDHFGVRTREQWPATARAYGFGDGAFYIKHVRFRDGMGMRLFARKVLKEAARPVVTKVRGRHYAPDYAIGFIQGVKAGIRHPLVRSTRRYDLGA